VADIRLISTRGLESHKRVEQVKKSMKKHIDIFSEVDED